MSAASRDIAVTALWFVGAGTWFYVQSSFWESLFHQYLLDLTPAQRAWMFRLKRWFPSLWLEHHAHNVLHHFRTYRVSYVEQFSTTAEREALEAVLRKQLDAKAYRQITTTHFGASFQAPGLPYLAPAILNLAWLPFMPNLTVAMAVLLADLLFGTPYWVFSKWVHLHMHQRFADTMREAPWPLRLILRSDYGLAVRISHFVHHKDPVWNYNLQYVADLIRGCWRAPTVAEWDEMVGIGLITPSHRQKFEGRRFLGHPF